MKLNIELSPEEEKRLSEIPDISKDVAAYLRYLLSLEKAELVALLQQNQAEFNHRT